MLMSNVTALQTRNELIHWENRPFCKVYPQLQRRMTSVSAVAKAPRKKKRVRTCFTTQQLIILEEIFSKAKYIDSKYRKDLAQSLQLEDKIIKVWFQNRRMKEKKDSSDSTLEISSGNSTCDSSSSPVNCIEDTNCETINEPREATSVTEDQANTDFSDYQITFNQHLDNQNHAATNSDNMYPTGYIPSYRSEYYSNISNQYLNQNSENANASHCSWYVDANNYFNCNN